MPKVHLECMYCGKTRLVTFYNKPDIVKCSVCFDDNIRFKELETTDVFGYKNDTQHWEKLEEIERKRKRK